MNYKFGDTIKFNKKAVECQSTELDWIDGIEEERKLINKLYNTKAKGIIKSLTFDSSCIIVEFGINTIITTKCRISKN